MTIVGDIAAVRGLEENTSNLFRLLLLQMAERLGSNADWHAAVMVVETAGTFDPGKRNPQGGATGLIQFMPDTARRLGTSTDDLAAMSREEQLLWVEKYYRPHAGKMRSVEDVYMATFMPSMVGLGSNNVVGERGNFNLVPGAPFSFDTVYRQNKGFDRDGDGVITNGEVGAAARGVLTQAEDRPRLDVFSEDEQGKEGGSGDPGPPLSPWLDPSLFSDGGSDSSGGGGGKCA